MGGIKEGSPLIPRLWPIGDPPSQPEQELNLNSLQRHSLSGLSSIISRIGEDTFPPIATPHSGQTTQQHIGQLTNSAAENQLQTPYSRTENKTARTNRK